MNLFEGVYTALVTPFKDSQVDFPSLERLIESQLKNGVKGFVVNGTTAESPTLNNSEKFEILKFVKSHAGTKAKVIFGSGTNSTAETVELSRKAESIGVDGLLVVVPYYNKPPQEGMYQHFTKVADSVSAPIMLYNVPGRTVVGLEAETIFRLAEHKNIQAIKEASGNMQLGKTILAELPEEFIVSSGDDETCLQLKSLGGKGVVSVCSHILPAQMVRWFSGSLKEEYFSEFEKYKELISSLYISANPIPVKYALKVLGIIEADEVRLPLVQLNEGHKKVVEAKLKNFSGKLV